MIERPIDAIDEQTLAALIAREVSECRDLEFKRDLPGGAPDDAKEFLADVTSLANAQGGDLIFGIEDIGGVASSLPGVLVSDADAAVLRLENMLRDSVDPRLTGVRIRWVSLASGASAIIIRVPASLAAPHRVRVKRSGPFYNRNSRGKYEMDAHELRQAFTQSGQLPQRFRQLHRNAVAAASGVEMPFAVDSEPTAVVSVLPLGHFREQRDLAVTWENALAPVRPSGMSWRLTIEGVLMHTPVNAHGTVSSYALTYRTGRTDAAWTIGGVREFQSGKAARYVWPERFESGLLDMAASTPARLNQFGVEGPWVVLTSILSVKEYKLFIDDYRTSDPAWRDSAMLGELVVDHVDQTSLLPVFKTFWLAFGEQRPANRSLG